MTEASASTGEEQRRSLERSLTETVGSLREARWLLDEALSGEEGPISEDQQARARRWAERRSSSEPLQYVLGHWPFRELDLLVDERALIPRPETEWVTDVALAELDRLLASGAPPRVLDLGTGTGAIALSIATERGDHHVEVIATDRDPAVLELARLNQDRLTERPGVARVRFRAGWWFDALEDADVGTFSLIVSNPPYVDAHEWEFLDPVVRDHEPYGALVAGAGSDATPGFADVEKIVGHAGHWLGRPGVLVVEIAPAQATAAQRCAEHAGCSEVAVLDDLAGRPRALVARFR